MSCAQTSPSPSRSTASPSPNPHAVDRDGSGTDWNAPVRTARCSWTVRPTYSIGDTELLEPVILRSDAGSFNVQDYLTPEQARAVAHLLLAAANDVDHRRSS